MTARLRRGWLAVPLLLVGAVSASGQDATPLQKSDVVRLLSGGTYTQPEVAEMVRRSCLSFRPTERDLQSFRSLGAGDAVMGAIRGCARSAPAENAPRPQPPRAQSPAPDGAPANAGPGDEAAVATLFISPRRVQVSAGEEARVTAELTYGATPARAVRLALQQGRPGETGGVVDTATTGADGRATFRIPPSPEPGLRVFTVVAPEGAVRGDNVVEVRIGSSGLDPLLGAEARSGEDEGRRSGEEAGRRSDEGDERRVDATAPSRATASGEGGTAASGPGEMAVEDLAAAREEADRASREGRYARAEALFQALLERGGSDVDLLLAYGEHLTRSGSHAEAARVLRRAEVRDPSRVDVLKALGFAELWGDRPMDAVRRYRRATDLAPDDVEAWRGLARALGAAGREDEARRAARRAAELSTGS